MKERRLCKFLLLLSAGKAAKVLETCWSGPFTWTVCCDQKHGPSGNQRCWLPEEGFTYERCCLEDAVQQQGHAVPSDGDLPALPSAEATHSCWSGDYTPELCCDTTLGPSGNSACWDSAAGFTFAACCKPPALDDEPTSGWARALVVGRGSPVVAEGMSVCKKSFRNTLAPGLPVSWFVGNSGDPTAELLALGHLRSQGNWRECQRGPPGAEGQPSTMWSARATLFQSACSLRGRGEGQSSCPFTDLKNALSFEICTHPTCSAREAAELAGELLIDRLDALYVMAGAEVRVQRQSAESMEYPFVARLFWLFGGFTLSLGLIELWHPSRALRTFSAADALRELAAEEQGRDVFRVHCLRVVCTSAQHLCHFVAEWYMTRSTSFQQVHWVLRWWVTGFFVISAYLQVHGCRESGRVTLLSARLFRRLQRQAIIASIFCLLQRKVVPALLGKPEQPLPRCLLGRAGAADNESLCWLNLLLHAESLPWQWRLELWQQLLLACLLVAEAMGAGALAILWLFGAVLALPRSWDTSDDLFPAGLRGGDPLVRFWSLRLPVILLALPLVRVVTALQAWWPRFCALSACICWAVSLSATWRMWTPHFPLIYELSFWLPALLFLPLPSRSTQQSTAEMHQESGETTTDKDKKAAERAPDLLRQLVLVAARVSPIATAFDHLYRNLFACVCPTVGRDWVRLLVFQGPVYVVWVHVVACLVWVLYLRPLQKLLTGATSLIPERTVHLFVMPCFVAALGFMVQEKVVPTYFKEPYALLWRSFADGTLRGRMTGQV